VESCKAGIPPCEIIPPGDDFYSRFTPLPAGRQVKNLS